ncbi:pyridoxal phosphate-dependent aminotransferase [Aquamicrobium sp. LC103]|uniref:pyridoxal phosphate-dependent aminotransferase n=1 Tax=Aquamicrobium sp. LC103 TaxID=1120658 RepID=UPI00063ED146|nr:pyridoxal phosphate-dependent aminotransferase [Aquamicrobium sp. LC103]TKT76235.1 pyridoxal phosphate-dependent aminotransferase [Aquamicrobium sp. LC103]
MSFKLSDRVSNLKPSASIAAKKRVTELQAAGRQIIDFTIGEPDLDTPDFIIDAAIKAMREGDTHYTATQGTPALRDAICNKLKRENGIDVQPENIVVGCGAKQLIFEAFAATLDEGDEVIVPAPYWVSYPDIVKVNGGTPVIVECGADVDFKLKPHALSAALTPNMRWLILNSPNNPTGAVYSAKELAALLDVLRLHPQVCLIMDDIYEHLVYDGASHASPLQIDPAFAERSLLINGVSKAYAMTGWRVGYAAGPKPLVAAIGKLLGQNTTCASSISQAGATAALEGDQAPVREMTALYEQRRNRMIELLEDVPGFDVSVPSGAFYLFPSVAELIGRRTPQGQVLHTDLDVAAYLLEAANVAVMDGSSYGLSPYLRLSFATSTDRIEEGCRRIRKATEALA